MRLSAVLSFLSLASTVVYASPLPKAPKRPIVSKRQQAYLLNGRMVVNNNLGQAYGVPVGDGSVYRFAVKYATAARFGNPNVATQWLMPNNDPNALPPACPQPGLSPSQYSEDCLYAVAYVPASVLNNVNAPIYMWFHGGSFLSGSASDPGLEGSKLAKAMNGIVVFVQYRLGVLGFLPPSTASTASGNLAVKDAITALKFAQNTLNFFGGNGKITVAGQSSGAHLVRALLASPEASQYFQAATLHGDPIQFGFLKKPVYQSLQSTFYSTFCNGGNTQCLNSKSTADIITAQTDFLNTGPTYYLDPSIGAGEPLRPTLDGTTVKYTLTTTYPPTKKPVLITTNKNEGGQAVGTYFPPSYPTEEFYPTIQMTLGEDRAETVNESPYYNPEDPTVIQTYSANGDITRQAFDRVGTDQSWRCTNWDFARRWTKAGGSAYVGVFQLGATYPSNAGIDYCTTSDKPVCHEDEIYILFGSTPSPTSAQTALSNEMQARFAKFINSPTVGPNPTSGVGSSWKWNAAGQVDAKAVRLGGPASGQAVPANGCDPAFWGASVPFEWQMYGE